MVASYEPVDPAASFCVPGQQGVIACPCANPPGSPVRGCENSAATGGARLFVGGYASITADTLLLQTSGQLPSGFSVVLQGNAVDTAGLVFGEGVRCVTGALKRLQTENAVNGAIVYPDGGETLVAAMSASLGDPIGAGSTRWYQVYYRDPSLPCAFELNFNATQGLSVLWHP